MKNVKRFIAIRNSEDETTMALMTCVSYSHVKTPEEFLEKLKKAVTQWIKVNPDGKQAWVYSGEDFNFGDLSSYCQTEAFQNILSLQGIFEFDMEVISKDGISLDFDEVLVNTEEL